MLGFLKPSTQPGRQIDLEHEYAVPVRDLKKGNHEFIEPYIPLERDRSVLVLGENGSGKTSAIKLFREQLNSRPDEPIAILDYKDDLDESGFYDPELDIVLSVEDSSRYWNIFSELDERGDYEAVAKTLAADISEKGFFQTGAQRVIQAALMAIDETNDNPTNSHLYDFFIPHRENYTQHLASLFRNYEGDYRAEVMAAAPSLNPNSDVSAVNMYQSVAQRIHSTFVGDFKEDGDFSIREYMQNPDGRAVVINMRSDANRATAAYRLIMDLVLYESQNIPDRYVYVLIDEFNRLGQLQQLEDFTATIRAKKGQAVLCVQSISAIEDTYGENTADDILNNAPQKIFMRSTGRNVEFALDAIGSKQKSIDVADPSENQKGYMKYTLPLLKRSPFGLAAAGAWSMISRITSDDNSDIQKKRVTYNPIPEGEFSELADGEAVINSPKGFARVQFEQWHTIPADMQASLSGRSATHQEHQTQRLAAIAENPHISDVEQFADALSSEDEDLQNIGIFGLINICETGEHQPEEVITASGLRAERLIGRLIEIATTAASDVVRFNAIVLLEEIGTEHIDQLHQQMDTLSQNLEADDEDLRFQTTTLLAGLCFLHPEPDTDIRDTVRENLVTFADHSSPAVRQVVAGFLTMIPQTDASETALNNLAADENPDVRAVVQNRLAVIESSLHISYAEQFADVLLSEDVKLQNIGALAADENLDNMVLDQLGGTAENPHISDAEQFADALSSEDEKMQSVGVVGLVNLYETGEYQPEEVITASGLRAERLIDRLTEVATTAESDEVRCLAVALLEMFGTYIDQLHQQMDRLSQNLDADDEDLRFQTTLLLAGLCLHPESDPDIEETIRENMIEFADHSSPAVRQAVAGCLALIPQTDASETALDNLAADENPDVRAAVRNPQSAFDN